MCISDVVYGLLKYFLYCDFYDILVADKFCTYMHIRYM